MKAAVIHEQGPPDVLRIEDVPDPTPSPTQAVIKVRACGVCGHDQADRLGLTKPHGMPCILGHEIAGEVVEVGSMVRHFRPGDVVASKQFTTCGQCLPCRSGKELDCERKHFIYGGYAEYVAVEDDALLRLPEGVDVVGASIVACAVGTCYQALTNIAQLRPEEWVVVTGAGGGLGLHGVQVAAALGGRVIALTTSPQKNDFLSKIGAERVVVGRDEPYANQILEITGGAGAQVVLDQVGHPTQFNQCFRALAKRGRYVLTGQLFRERIGLYAAFVFGKEAVITGSQSTPMSAFMRSMDLVRDGRVKPVYETVPLDEVVKAHTAIDEHTVVGRAVLTP
jgi:D-arabinose 1-dehydrogenase-like Zn-dependent alcohol dehydrogenase